MRKCVRVCVSACVSRSIGGAVLSAERREQPDAEQAVLA